MGLAYFLFLQGLMIGVGLGMRAGADAAGLADTQVICRASTVSLDNAKSNERHSAHLHCPFCFVAAQSAGQIATVDPAANLARLRFDIRELSYRWFVDRVPALPSRRRTCDPRGPPQFSV